MATKYDQMIADWLPRAAVAAFDALPMPSPGAALYRHLAVRAKIAAMADQLEAQQAEIQRLTGCVTRAVQESTARQLAITAERDKLRADLTDMIRNFEAAESEAEQLRTLVQALRFDTDERDRLEKALANSHRDYLNIADALLPTSSGPQDLIDRAHKLRSTLAEVALERDEAISERDAYRAMVCDILAASCAYPMDHPAFERIWERTRDLLKNGPTKP